MHLVGAQKRKEDRRKGAESGQVSAVVQFFDKVVEAPQHALHGARNGQPRWQIPLPTPRLCVIEMVPQ